MEREFAERREEKERTDWQNSGYRRSDILMELVDSVGLLWQPAESVLRHGTTSTEGF